MIHLWLLKVAADASAYRVWHWGRDLARTCTPTELSNPLHLPTGCCRAVRKITPKLKRKPWHWCTVYIIFLYGWRFTLVTDHRPLTTISSPKRGIPFLAAAKVGYIAIYLLSADWYDIEFKHTQDDGNADGLSRLYTTSKLVKEPQSKWSGNIPSMAGQSGCKSVYSPTRTGEMNSLWKVIACCGALVWLCLKSYKRRCWICCIVDTREQLEWKLWREAMFGGPALTRIWRRLIRTVKLVNPCRVAQQLHHYTLGHG